MTTWKACEPCPLSKVLAGFLYFGGIGRRAMCFNVWLPVVTFRSHTPNFSRQ